MSAEGISNDFLDLKLLRKPIWLMTFKFKAFSLDAVEAINKALDYLDAQTGELGLITTSSHAAIYSAGIDFTMFGHSVTFTKSFLMHIQRLFARMLGLSYPTVAAINGHCIAAGIMFAMGHDFRVQRKDLGTICLSEINMGKPIPLGMMVLIQDKVSHPTMKMLAMFGHKFSPEESLKAGLVDKLVDKDKLIDEAIQLLDPLVEKSSAREAFGQIKTEMNIEGIKAAYEGFLPPLHLLKPNL